MKAAFYKARRPGFIGIYGIIVKWFERGKYSHCELIFSDGMAASSSFMDGGVRFKRIDFHPEHWDFIELPSHLEPAARAWFEAHNGEHYDIIGNVRFLIDFIPDDRNKRFCSEAIADALGIPDAWRLGPNGLYAVLDYINRCTVTASLG